MSNLSEPLATRGRDFREISRVNTITGRATGNKTQEIRLRERGTIYFWIFEGIIRKENFPQREKRIARRGSIHVMRPLNSK